jgi:hypothetical protein
MITGMSLEHSQQVTANDLLEALDGLPANHIHCAVLAVQTLGEAIASIEF